MSLVHYKVGPRMSQAVVANGILFTSAQVATNFGADAAEQTRQVLAKVDALLTEAGTNKASVLQATILLSSMDYYEAMNAVWDAWIIQGSPPARLCFETKFSSPKILVEIAVIANV